MKVHQKNIQSSINSLLSKNKKQDYGVYNGVVTDTNTNEWDGSKGWKSPRRWQSVLLKVVGNMMGLHWYRMKGIHHGQRQTYRPQ